MDTANTAATAAASVATLTSGVSSSFFLDPEGRQTFELQEWLRLVKNFHHEGKPIPPLLINGLVKTGKSFMLNEVLPAVARTYYGSSSSGSGGSGGSGGSSSGGSGGSGGSSGSGNGGGGDNGGSGSNSGGQQQHSAAAAAVLPEPNFLHVNCMGCERVSGTGGFLADFLRLLTRSAAVQQLSDAASTPVPSSGVTGVLVASIQDFMWRLPRDRLNFLLIDEAQSFYLLVQQPDAASAAGTRAQQQRGGPVPDQMAVESMRRVLKQLQLDSPPWVAWAVTGSAMATLWANMAATPTNGFPLNMHHYRLDLRPAVPTDVLRVAWHQLKRQAAAWSPPPPDDLVWRSPPHHATLAFLCQEWRVHCRTASSAELLVQQTMTQKLLPEVLADLRAVLAEVGQPDMQLLLLHRLLDPLAGVEQPGSYGSLHPAFVALLASYTTTHGGGSRLFLDSPPFAEVLQAITKASGALVDSPAAIQWPGSCRLRFWRELITLCKTCEDSDDLDSCMDLHALLGDMAAALQLPPDDLLKAKWFVDIRDHDYNGHRYDFVKEYEAQAQQDAKVGLRCFHALLRPVLDYSYSYSWDQQLRLKHAYPPELHEFLSSGRVSEVLTKTYNRPLPNRSGKLNAPRAQVQQVQQPHARPPSRPVSLCCWGKQPLRRAVRYMGRM